MKFEYLYGKEADRFTFYRIPKLLITSPEFSKLSNSAKLLYGLMLDIAGMSAKNGWVDDQNRVYIRYSVNRIMEDMNCREGKACKLLKELDTEYGCGLIHRVKLGQGKQTVIYVKKFYAVDDEAVAEMPALEDVTGKEVYSEKTDVVGDRATYTAPEASETVEPEPVHDTEPEEKPVYELPCCNTRDISYDKSDPHYVVEIASQDFRKPQLQTCDNSNFRIAKDASPELRKSQSNYNNINNNNFNDNDVNDTPSINNTVDITVNNAHEPDVDYGRGRQKGLYKKVMAKVKEQIDYDYLVCYYNRNVVNNIVDAMTDVMAVYRDSYTIQGKQISGDTVIEKFEMITAMQIDILLLDYQFRQPRIYDPSKYFISKIYNLPKTSEFTMDTIVNSTLYQTMRR